VAQIHEVAGFVDLALEATEGGFDGFAFSDLDLDIDGELGGRGGDWKCVGKEKVSANVR